MEFYGYGQEQSIVKWLRGSVARDRLSVLFLTFKSMCTVAVYTFRVRDRRTGNWRDSRRKMTIGKAEQRYGAEKYEVLESSKEMRWRSFLRRVARIFK